MKKTIANLMISLVVALVAFFVGRWYNNKHPRTKYSPDTKLVYDTLTYVDTVKYYPVSKSEKPNGYAGVQVNVAYLHEVLDSLPRIRADTANVTVYQNTVRDSVILQLPMTQTIYGDSTYTAWISGVNARMDSIYVYPKREIITIKHPPKRWHIGLTGGYGFTQNGSSTYIGIGVTYSLISF